MKKTRNEPNFTISFYTCVIARAEGNLEPYPFLALCIFPFRQPGHILWDRRAVTPARFQPIPGLFSDMRVYTYERLILDTFWFRISYFLGVVFETIYGKP